MALKIFIYVCTLLTTCAALTVTNLEELRNTTCLKIYQSQPGYSTGGIDFSAAIRGLKCPPRTYYHCLPDTRNRTKIVQFCTDWIWIEEGKCPSYYSYQTAIQPYKCSKNDTGCPSQQYKSNEYYKYIHCLTSQQSSDKSSTKKATDGQENDGQSSTVWIIIVAVMAVVIVVLAALVFTYKWRRNIASHSFKGARDQEEGMRMVVKYRNTRSFERAKSIIINKGHVVIAGKPGSGRETLIRQLFESYKETQNPDIELKNPKYKHFHLKSNVPYFIVVNEHWIKDYHLEALKKEFAKLQQDSVYVIEMSQSCLMKNDEIRRDMEGAIVDLSSEQLELKYSEKKEFLDAFCESNGVTESQFPEERRDQVCHHKQQNYGFFHLCKKLVESKEFDNPLEFIRRIDSPEG